MSNLLKYGYFVPKEENRVIDYNELVQEKINKIQESKRRSELMTAGGEETEGEGFVPGLKAEELELIMEDQENAGEPVQELPDAQELYTKAQAEIEEMLEQAKQEAEVMRQNAYQEGLNNGYQEGLVQAQTELAQQSAALEEQMRELEEEYRTRQKTMEPELVNVLCDIYEHVFQVNFASKKDMILYLLQSTMGNISDNKEFIVKTSSEDFAFVKENRGKIATFALGADSVDVMEDATLKKNQCIIETEGGVFDCSVDVQLDALRKALETLSYR